MADCSACSAPLAAGARFCHECGTPATVPACPACGATSVGGRFCHECGSPLSGASAQVTAPAAEAVPVPVAERRITSVLFGDLVGFTPLSESRDAEDVRELLSRYFTECRTVIGRYGGTVEKFIGDAVMAVWGVPVAHEDDAERAVRAGLELVSMVAGLGEQVGAPGLAMRVGVVTGEVAVTVGATAEGMVAGDAVNTAARVQSAAEPGTVWVDDGTRSLTSSSVVYEDTGEHELKGKAEPLRLFCARAILTDMRGARVDGLEAPMVGRDRELRLVKELFHAAEEADRPRLVVVDGEAGIGKSRLAWEFEKYVDGLTAQVLWHRGRCLSYGDGVAYWALSEAVRTRLGLTEGEAGAIVEQRLDEGLATFVPDPEERAWLRPRLAVLVRSDRDATHTRSELFVAWTTWFERLAQTGEPVVLLVDDAQHADDGLLDFAEHLLSNATGAIFVLALARPSLLDRRQNLGGRRSTVIHLEPLEDDAMAHLVDGLVDGLEPGARAALVQRSDGVPLFAVETVRALIDRDLVVPREGRYVPAHGSAIDLDAIGAPATLQTLVAARLDALTPAERLVVADASVLGATFTREGLAALSGERSELNDAVTSLLRKEIFAIQQDRFASDRGQLRFVQAVVRQVAYATQSRRDRKTRHLAAADHLAALPESAELVEVQAQHVIDAVEASSVGDADIAELTARSATLLTRAAERSRSLGSMAEARRLFEAACDRTTDPNEHARLLYQSGLAARDAGSNVEGAERCERAVAEYDALGLDTQAGLAAGWASLCWWREGEATRALELAQPRWDQLQGRRDADEALMRLSAVLIGAATTAGDNDLAFQLRNRRLRIAERIGDRSEIALVLLTLGFGYQLEGAPETASALIDAAVRQARLGTQLDALSSALANQAALNLSRDLAAAERAAREGMEVARRTGIMEELELTMLNLAMAHWQSGRLQESQELVRELDVVSNRSLTTAVAAVQVRLADAFGGPLLGIPDRDMEDDPYFMACVLDVATHHALAAGDGRRAGALVDEAMPLVLRAMGIDDDFAMLWPVLVRGAIASGDRDRVERMFAPVEAAGETVLSPAVLAELHWLRGLTGATFGDPADVVEPRFREGIARLDAFGARGHAATAREDLGRWLVGQGRTDDAETVLAQARATYEEIGAGGWLARLDTWQRQSQKV